MIKGQQAQTGISSVQPNRTKQVVQVTTYIRSMLLPPSGSVQNADNKLVALSKQQVGSTKYHTTLHWHLTCALMPTVQMLQQSTPDLKPQALHVHPARLILHNIRLT